MLKSFWFRLIHNRTEKVSSTIIDDLKWFLDLNYIAEDAAEEATASLYENVELSREIEPVGILLGANEYVEESKARSTEEEYPVAYSYSSDSVDNVGYGAACEYGEADQTFDNEFLCEKSISAFQDDPEPPRAPASFSKRRVLPSFPQLKKEEKPKGQSFQAPQLQQQSLEDVISVLGLTFQQQLLGLIDEKGYTDSQVYRKANLDRKLFSKIRCNKDYKPSKLTALSLAIALELNLDEATDLLGRAGLALSPSNLTDMIIKYCITHQIYDIYDVNALLYEYDQQLLGC